METELDRSGGKQRDGATQRVLRTVRARIVNGELVPGQTLNQSSLARELKVSRIPVREAFGLLVGEGLLRVENGTECVTPLSTQELQEIYDIREALEPLVTRLGLSNTGRAQILVMERQLERMSAAQGSGDFADWLEANATFHREIYGQSNRRRMIDIIDRLTKETDRYLMLYRKIWTPSQVDEEHQRILEAVRAKNPVELEQATLDHLRNAHDTLLTYMIGSEISDKASLRDRSSP